MMVMIRPGVTRRMMALPKHARRVIMVWETPCAIEMRFGMEITMYVSNR
jgi:coenzyme PQQ precursor peptide PqqA